MKIGITGAEGTIGSVLRKGLSKKYKIISFTLQTQDFESVQVDLSNNNEIKGKFEGLDALIHLAADPRPEASWESVKINNIEANKYPISHTASSIIYLPFFLQSYSTFYLLLQILQLH